MDSIILACLFVIKINLYNNKTVLASRIKKKRTKYSVRERLNWDFHVQKLLNEGEFRRYYRMPSSHFEILLAKLAPHITGDTKMSKVATKRDPITSVNKLQFYIFWISGHHYQTTRVVSGVSVASFYRCIWQVVDAIGAIIDDDVAVTFPQSNKEIQQTTQAFRSLSDIEVIQGCIGCVDGWLSNIVTPRKKK